MTVLARRPLTAALLEVLAAATQRPVGDGEAPVDAEYPYLIVELVPGRGTSGPVFVAPDADAVFVYQVSVVGLRQDQVEMAGDRARAAVLARTPTGAFVTALAPTGMVVTNRWLDSSSGPIPEGSIITAAERYALAVTPSA